MSVRATSVGSDLPYGESQAWIALVSMTIGYLPYFAVVAWRSGESESSTLLILGLFASATIVRLTTMGAGYLALSRREPSAAIAFPDERDLTIARRAASLSYLILLGWMVIVGVVMPFDKGGWEITQAALFAIVITETFRYAMTIFVYRRGLDG